MNCPACGHQFEPPNGQPKGVEIRKQDTEEIDSGSESGEREIPGEEETKSANVPLFDPNHKPRTRGKAGVYTSAFEVAWRAYGRKQEKLRAYREWIVQGPTVGGETRLLQLILAALKWQAPGFAEDGWKYAPYFERYLRGRKWEDEPLPAPSGAHNLSKTTQATMRGMGAFIANGQRGAK